MLERAVERRSVAYAKGLGCLPLKLWPTLAGLPDRLVLIPGGRVAFVEFKTATGRVSPIQSRVFDLLARLGFPVNVCRSFDAFKMVLDTLMERRR